MARSGINKALVQMAQERLLARGENPSIDAVRIELGNTGSKATIHRYLKELNEEAGVYLREQAHLSDPLTELVGRLAAQLHQEALAVVDQAETQQKVLVAGLNTQLAAQHQALAEADTRIATLTHQLAESDQAKTRARADYHALALQAERQTQQLSDQAIRLAERDDHLQSLEDKHQHARDALTHYRESVKEQRDQEQRRHEQQVHQLQTELRQLSQTITIKQADITQLNIDNARLIAEISEVRKQLMTAESTLRRLETQLKSSDEQVALSAARLAEAANLTTQYRQDLATLGQQLKDNEQTQKDLEIWLSALKSELAVKNELFGKMGLAVSV